MRRLILSLLCGFASLVVMAQPGPPKGFNPEKFQRDLEQFITTEAVLTPQEAAKFFPLYREWKQKERVLFDQRRRYRWTDSRDDRSCRQAIRKLDELDIQQKELQQTYHQKFLKILPATKVFAVIRAEGEFHRKVFKRIIHRKQ